MCCAQRETEKSERKITVWWGAALSLDESREGRREREREESRRGRKKETEKVEKNEERSREVGRRDERRGSRKRNRAAVISKERMDSLNFRTLKD
jgi:hypothetical protein